MLKIESVEDYLSLKKENFKNFFISKFSVITGLNGAGKSHFLQAISSFKINVYEGDKIIRDIWLYNSLSERRAALDQKASSANHKEEEENKKQIMRRLGRELDGFKEDYKKGVDVFKDVKERNNSNYDKIILYEILQKSGKSIEDLDLYDIECYYPIDTNRFHDVFDFDIGEFYEKYRNKKINNFTKESLVKKEMGRGAFIVEEKFSNAFGEEPWKAINNALEVFGSDIRTNDPGFKVDSFQDYYFKFKNIKNDVDIMYRDLSKGEQIIVSMASVYCKKLINNYTSSLMLLDEPDVHLHPSMVRSLIRVFREYFVDEKGINVILTTHSPTTVAMSPDESIFLMTFDEQKLKSVGKNTAINSLLDGVPTLSVGFDGGRQVFVESSNDAILHSKLYELCKLKIDSERKLSFIPVGNKTDSGGEKNAGCDQVIRIVGQLKEFGNNTIFGLVDWDNRRKPNGRIHVLSCGIRDAIENVIYDPVILFISIMKYNKIFLVGERIIATDVYTDIIHWKENKWQECVNYVQKKILGKGIDECEKKNICYLNGMKIDIANEYLVMKDKKLAEKVLSEFPFLERDNAKLMKRIVDEVLCDHKQLIPIDLVDTYEGILNDEVD